MAVGMMLGDCFIRGANEKSVNNTRTDRHFTLTKSLTNLEETFGPTLPLHKFSSLFFPSAREPFSVNIRGL